MKEITADVNVLATNNLTRARRREEEEEEEKKGEENITHDTYEQEKNVTCCKASNLLQ
jgi:hypothetical protein